MKIIDVVKRWIINSLEDWKLARHQVEWRSLNTHNHTRAGNVFPLSKVSVGKQTYGTLNVLSYDNEEEHLDIGNYCSIATNTNFILSGEHRFDCLSSFPFRKILLKEKSEAICKGKIVIEDDVWIGFGCTILSGVKIGKGAVIGAGSIITKDIPPYAVYANNRILRYRFSADVIEKLESLDYSKLKEVLSETMLSSLEICVNADNVEEIIRNVSE